mmetsp:Transcript_48518/g.149768  ORF Transcript_48518/g.149768 Transcript_48518/m.149768 type:complete len:298 (+) Transcript_48518:1175-2068(+)
MGSLRRARRWRDGGAHGRGRRRRGRVAASRLRRLAVRARTPSRRPVPLLRRLGAVGDARSLQLGGRDRLARVGAEARHAFRHRRQRTVAAPLRHEPLLARDVLLVAAPQPLRALLRRRLAVGLRLAHAFLECALVVHNAVDLRALPINLREHFVYARVDGGRPRVDGLLVPLVVQLRRLRGVVRQRRDARHLRRRRRVVDAGPTTGFGALPGAGSEDGGLGGAGAAIALPRQVAGRRTVGGAVDAATWRAVLVVATAAAIATAGRRQGRQLRRGFASARTLRERPRFRRRLRRTNAR